MRAARAGLRLSAGALRELLARAPRIAAASLFYVPPPQAWVSTAVAQVAGPGDVPKRRVNFDRVLAALGANKARHGDLLVPQSFVVPAEWGEDIGGLKLGNTVSAIRNSGTYAEHRPELEAMGFDYERQEIGDWARMRAALGAYKVRHGDLLVPRSFVVPAEWGAGIAGLKLGSTVNNIRNSGN